MNIRKIEMTSAQIDAIVESPGYEQMKAAYSLALKLFARGENAAANELLELAFQSNYWVSLRLLGRKDAVTFVSEEQHRKRRESTIYVERHLREWEETSGALSWLNSELRKEHRRQNQRLQRLLAKIPKDGPLAWLVKQVMGKVTGRDARC